MRRTASLRIGRYLVPAAVLSIVACAIILLVIIASPPDDKRVVEPGSSTDLQVIRAASSRIATESRGDGSLEPVVERAPRSGNPRRAPPVAEGAAPRPPEGYTFIEHQGQMPTARIRESVAGPESVDHGPDWLGAPEAIATLVAQANTAGREWSFGWIRLADDARLEDLALALGGTGAEILGLSGRLVRARLPADRTRLEAIAALPSVDGLGGASAEAKQRWLADELMEASPGEPLPVFVTLMADDADGRWRRALEDLGAVVGSYDAALRMYRANAEGDVLDALAASDFVLAVEPIGVVEAAHDTAVPAMGADAVRAYDGAPGIFSGTGGASVPVGVLDTGLNIHHLDIASHRDSICGANFVVKSRDDDSRTEAADLWFDDDGHGTHVTGTIAGNGMVERRFAGMAPSVRHIRFAKVLDRVGRGDHDAILRGMDYIASAGCGAAEGAVATEIPLVVNMSLSSNNTDLDGRRTPERKLDAQVWGKRQLYVVSQANFGITAYSEYAAAKNSLAVGAALDSGELAYFSSRGPTVDGRLAPNLVATGVAVHSARGAGSGSEYDRRNGTSMASPSVAGVAALLMDALPAHRKHPALTRARLMGSAIRPDAWLDDATAFPLDNSSGPGALQAGYGMGKASARASILDRDQADGWTSGGATAVLGDGEYASQEIVVPEGTHRLDLVLTWDEPPAEAIARTVLNDLDLWLDGDGDCDGAACGEYASTSRIDNVEWIIVRDPAPGTYTAKVVASRVYGTSPRAGLSWTVIRGKSTPTLSVTPDQTTLDVDDRHDLTLTVTTDAYVAAGTRLHLDCDDPMGASGCDGVTFESMAVTREDGVAVDLTKDIACIGADCVADSIAFGASIPLGEIAVGESQEVTFGIAVDGNATTARLHFSASAWNAEAGSVSIDIGTVDRGHAEPVASANDRFAAAAVLEGEEGSRELNLLLATTEPGEPPFDAAIGQRTPGIGMAGYRSYPGRPAGSVWYEWTAPSTGSFHFHVPSPGLGVTDRIDRVDVFTGDAIAALERVGSGRWGASVFAQQGAVYRIRVGYFLRGVPVELRWSRQAPPVNDNFAAATVLQGEQGVVNGTTVGATLEADESLGSLAATTWYRWTAPRDGNWDFWTSGERYVGAYAADSLASRRLVGPLPGALSRFRVREGTEYRIAVAEPHAYSPTGEYVLRWTPHSGELERNDRFVVAESILGEASGTQIVEIDNQATVEPGEPHETGVRTAWWVWQAPADDVYTWRVEPYGGYRAYSTLQVTALTGADEPGLADLDVLAQADPTGYFGFRLEATAGQRYWLAAGFPIRGSAAYRLSRVEAKLDWGPAPDNDDAASATALTGASGSVAGSNRYATAPAGPQSETLGHSTVWWTYEATASGWVRFSVVESGSWVLTVHREGADDALEVLASSRWQAPGRLWGDSGPSAVLFNAEPGVRYTISLGTRPGGTGGNFTLEWGEAEAPGWLRLAGRLLDGDRNASDAPVEIRGPAAMAVHASGSPLYLASSIGLQVFERDASTGGLDFLQLLDDDLARSSLLWDAQRHRLLVEDCGTWRAFASMENRAELEDGDELSVATEPGRCGNSIVIDATGSSVYRVGDGYVDLFSVDEAGSLSFVDGYEVPGVRSALLDNDGDRVYALTDGELRVFERDTETGRLTQRDYAATLASGRTLAITRDGTHLFVLDRRGEQTLVYGLAEDDPRYLAGAARFWRQAAPDPENECRFAALRDDDFVVDAFCRSAVFRAQWYPEDETVKGTDYIAPGLPDRHNNALPDFGFPRGMVASPDGRYVYLSTATEGILIFAGIGEADVDEAGDADLTIQSQWASDIGPLAGTAFTLNAVVRNRGDGTSAPTVIRAYRSEDAAVSTADSEVGSADFAGLAAGATRGQSITVTAADGPGTYYYGLCVDAPEGESDTSNNCSAAITITVLEDTRMPDLVVEWIAASVSTVAEGESFTVSTRVRNQGDGEADAATLRYYRSADATIGMDDTAVATAVVDGLGVAAQSGQTIDLEAPSDPGMYYYGACIDTVAREADTSNNCSVAVGITVTDTGEPDLAVVSPSVDSAEPAPEESFTLSVVVSNEGTRVSSAATLRYYQSDDEEISSADTEVGTASVNALDASATSEQSIDLQAPSTPGTYYYGACVEEDADETETGNNCSSGVGITVNEPIGQTCQVPIRQSGDKFRWMEIGPEQLEETSTGTAEAPFVQEGTFEDADDVHAYAITIDGDRRLEIKAEGGLDTQARFLVNDCTRAARYWNDAEWHDDYPGGDYEIYVAGNLGPGTYYLVVFTWASVTGDYELNLWTEEQPVNQPPEQVFGVVDSVDLPVDGSDTLQSGYADDDGDWVGEVSLVSADESIATAESGEIAWRYVHPEEGYGLDAWNGGVQRDYVFFSVAGHREGTTTITMTTTDQRGGSHAKDIEVNVVVPAEPAPSVTPTDNRGVDISFEVTLDANETRAYDVQTRRKEPQSVWWGAGDTGCLISTNDGDQEVTRTEVLNESGLTANAVYQARYRSRHAESCDSGDPDSWSAVGEGMAGS